MSLARRESRADFLEVSLQLLGSLGVEIGGLRWFFREENIIILEARSILYAVQYAESKYPPGRLLILSDNLALVLALCKAQKTHSQTLKTFYIAFSHASYLCVWFLGGFLSSFRWMIPSELNYSDKGSRFFDRDYDPSKSLASSCSCTALFSGTDKRPRLSSPSLMHLVNVHLISCARSECPSHGTVRLGSMFASAV